jgi:ABC-type multidrug transport system ATPase subunit
MSRPAVLAVNGLGKSFGSTQVLKAASFEARAGTVTALMGRNGAGKSTMLRIAVGRIRADYGRVVFQGKQLGRPILARMARQGLFYSAQDSALTDLFTVGDHLGAVSKVYGTQRRCPDTVVRLELERFLDRKPSTNIDFSARPGTSPTSMWCRTDRSRSSVG